MKITKPTKTTTIIPSAGDIQVHHHQSVKLSHNYQAVEVGYGLTLRARTEDEISTKAAKAEAMINRLMEPKVKESLRFLKGFKA